MNNYQIQIKLQPFESDRNLDELVELCNQNKVLVNISHEEKGTIKHCALDFLIIIASSPEFWVNIANGVISNMFYESFKCCISKITKTTKSSKHLNSMKIISDGTEFIVENENISDEIISKGLDTYKEIVLSNLNKELSWKEKMLNKTIVFSNDKIGEVEVLSELDYIKKHVAKTKPTEETINE